MLPHEPPHRALSDPSHHRSPLSFRPSFDSARSEPFLSRFLPTSQQPPPNSSSSPPVSEQQWTKYFLREIETARRPILLRNTTIFPVPQALFEVRPRAYLPRITAIGPFHRKLDPSPMDRCKALCLHEFKTRTRKSLLELMNCIASEPQSLESVYFGLPKFELETLRLILTADCVFILEFVLFFQNDMDANLPPSGYLSSYIRNDITFVQVLRDLFLAGNQVPLAFIKKLAALEGPETGRSALNLDYFIWRCNPFCMSHKESTTPHSDLQELTGPISLLDSEHLLDCLYRACVGTPKNGSSQKFDKPVVRIPRASELRNVGVKFKGRKGNTGAVKYHKSSFVFELPKLVVYDETEDLFRNLMAYELTSKDESEFCAYAIVMDSLIDTSEDLDLLYRAGVLENHLGNDEKLLNMWNDMCVNISENYSERWYNMTRDILSHYKSNWRVIYVEFHEKFFSRPWLWLSTLAAVLLLLMTALQTFISVLSYYKQ